MCGARVGGSTQHLWLLSYSIAALLIRTTELKMSNFNPQVPERAISPVPERDVVQPQIIDPCGPGVSVPHRHRLRAKVQDSIITYSGTSTPSKGVEVTTFCADLYLDLVSALQCLPSWHHVTHEACYVSDSFEFLPESRDVDVIYDDLVGELERGVHRALYPLERASQSAGSKRRAFELAVERETVLWNGVTLQSGERLDARKLREQKLIDLAKEKVKQEVSKVSKEHRMRQRAKMRDLKEAMELQGGKLLDVAGRVALGVAGAQLFRLARRCLRTGTAALDSSRTAANTASELLSTLNRMANQFKPVLGVLWSLPLVLGLYYALHRWPSPALTLATAVVLPSLLGPLWSYISEFFPTGNVLQSTTANMGRLFAVLFTGSVFRRKVNASTITEFCKRLSSMDRLTSGWDAFITWFMTGLEAIVNFAREKWGADKVTLFNRVDKEANAWMDEASSFITKDQTGSVMTPPRMDVALRLMQQGETFKVAYRGTAVGKQLDICHARLASVLAPHLGSVVGRNNFRPEPIACFFYGAPGVGKTALSVHFVTTVLLASGLLPKPITTDSAMSQIWQKGSSEYWQGYGSQLAIVMDDAFQNKSVTGEKDNDFFNLIKMVSSFSMPLNFADIASKGKIYFNSRFIYGSTNLSSIFNDASCVIHEPEAVARRLTHGYEMIVTPEFALSDGKLDYVKFGVALQACSNEPHYLDRYPWHVWELKPHNFITGATVGTSVGIRDLIVKLGSELGNRSGAYSTAIGAVSNMIDAFNNPIVTPSLLTSKSSFTPGEVTLQGGSLCSIAESLSVKEIFTRARGTLRALAGERKSDYHIVKKVLCYSLFTAAAFTVVRGLLHAFGSIVSSIFGKTTLQSNHPSTRSAKKKTFVAKTTELQSSGHCRVVENVFANSYKMVNVTSNTILGSVVFLRGTIAVQPQHFTHIIKSKLCDGDMHMSDTLLFRNSANPSMVVRYTVADYLALKRVSDEAADIEFIQFPSLRAHRDVVNACVRESDLKHISGNAVSLRLCQIDFNETIIGNNILNERSCNSVARRSHLQIGDRIMIDSWQYKFNTATKVGDCGSPLFLADSAIFATRPLLGLHCAGNVASGHGYSNVLTYERVCAAMSKFGVPRDDFESDLVSRKIELQACDVLPFDMETSFLALGTSSRFVAQNPVTQYYRTNMFGSMDIEYDKRPAVLRGVMRDGVPIFPMENALRPYATPLLELQVPNLTQSVHVAMKLFSEATFDCDRSLYTFDEAVLGVPQDRFRSIPRGTSPGFPYVLDHACGKKDFFGDSDIYDLSSIPAQELRSRVDTIVTAAKDNVRLSHVFVDFLKDELRSKEKVNNVATRLISSAPLDYVVAWRMYFGKFSSWMMRRNIYTGFGPGVCAYTQWASVADHLGQKGTKVFDGDFKSFDSSLQPIVMEAILDYINRWYDDGEENQRVRRVLWLELCHSRHIGGRGSHQNFVYQWNKSLPSGHPFTTILNSIYSLVVLVSSYIAITGDSTDFWVHVNALVYGDDNVLNVDTIASEVYHPLNLSHVLARDFGMVYTSGDKTATTSGFSKLSDVVFLKRRFVFEKEHVLCPLELESFLCTHYWCKNKKLERQILPSVLENALQELSMHTPSAWSKYATVIRSLLRDEFGLDTQRPLLRGEYQSLVLSREDDWF